MPDRSNGLLDSVFITLAPKDPGWVGGNFIKQLFEVRRCRQSLVCMPAQITMLAVESPYVLGADVAELRDRLLVPLFGPLKSRPFLEQDYLRAFDAEPNTHLVADGGRHASIAECTETPVHLRPLDLRQRHIAESLDVLVCLTRIIWLLNRVSRFDSRWCCP